MLNHITQKAVQSNTFYFVRYRNSSRWFCAQLFQLTYRDQSVVDTVLCKLYNVHTSSVMVMMMMIITVMMKTSLEQLTGHRHCRLINEHGWQEHEKWNTKWKMTTCILIVLLLKPRGLVCMYRGGNDKKAWATSCNHWWWQHWWCSANMLNNKWDLGDDG